MKNPTIQDFNKMLIKINAKFKSKASPYCQRYLDTVCTLRRALSIVEVKNLYTLWAYELHRDLYPMLPVQDSILYTHSAEHLDALEQMGNTGTNVLSWSLSKNIYRLDDDLFQILSNDTDKIDSISTDVLSQLPEYGLAMYAPMMIDDVEVLGFIVSYIDEYLNIVVIQKEHKEYVTQWFGYNVSLDDFGSFMELMADKEDPVPLITLKRILPLILYACSENFRTGTKPSDSIRGKVKARPGAFVPPSRTTIRLVGRDTGDAIRAFNIQSRTYQTDTGRTVRPHIRRAHWHTYWCMVEGTKQRVLKFIPHTFVNVKGD